MNYSNEPAAQYKNTGWTHSQDNRVTLSATQMASVHWTGIKISQFKRHKTYQTFDNWYLKFFQRWELDFWCQVASNTNGKIAWQSKFVPEVFGKEAGWLEMLMATGQAKQDSISNITIFNYNVLCNFDKAFRCFF